jgi:NADH-quinone oxidoreductase subunit L
MRRMGALRKFMPITAATFMMGWLAIVGLPPFSGFWSKDEVLLYALADNTTLYVIGVLTALLTALYMTRQVIMVFFGDAKWTSRANDVEAGATSVDANDVVDAAEDRSADGVVTHGAHGEFKPHESPPIMWIPLVVLSVVAALAGVLQLPALFGLPDEVATQLEEWLHPVIEFSEAEIDGTYAADHKYLLLAIAVAATLGGMILAWLIYSRRRIKAFEPALFANAWYYDSTLTDFVGGPGTVAFQGVADFDKHVVDGAVNGVATIVTTGGGELRKGQTGYVRQYAGIVGIGVVVVLIWFVVVRGIL